MKLLWIFRLHPLGALPLISEWSSAWPWTQHLVVGLAIAALAGAGRRGLSEVLGHHALLERRVELHVADLERVAEPAGGPESPVLRASGGVVQPVAGPFL